MPVYTVRWVLSVDVTAEDEAEAYEVAADVAFVDWHPHDMEVVAERPS